MTEVAKIVNHLMKGNNLAVILDDKKRLVVPKQDLKLAEAVESVKALLNCEEVLRIELL